MKKEAKIRPFWYSDVWLFPKLITIITSLDKDGKVSREEFIDMLNAICLFVKDDKCQEMLIEVLASLVAANWKVGGDDNNSVVRLQA